MTGEEQPLGSGKSAKELDLAKRFYAAIQHHTNNTTRSLQAKSFQVGVSDLGFCSERVRRMLDQQVPEDTDMLAAWIGTALGDHAEQAFLASYPDTARQTTVEVTLKGETREYTISGHPDLVLGDEGILIDVKTDYGLGTVRRSGPSLQQQFQRHLYAKGAHEQGLFGSMDLEDVQVANVWIDRSAIEKEVHVQLEPYDERYVEQAAAWLDEVIYAYLHNESARKEPPREMCAVVCGFFSVCRAYDTDVEGLLTAPEVVNATQMYRDGLDLEKAGKKLKDEAKQHLTGISGFTSDFMVRWTHVNESIIPETVRRGYDKLEVKARPVKKVTGK